MRPQSVALTSDRPTGWTGLYKINETRHQSIDLPMMNPHIARTFDHNVANMTGLWTNVEKRLADGERPIYLIGMSIPHLSITHYDYLQISGGE